MANQIIADFHRAAARRALIDRTRRTAAAVCFYAMLFAFGWMGAAIYEATQRDCIVHLEC